MRQFSKMQFEKILKENGFHYVRSSGSHDIWYNDKGKHITIPLSMNMCITRRLIKENNLKI